MQKQAPAENNLPPDDDGRSFADMNIDGMPWFSQKAQEERKDKKAKSEKAFILRSYVCGNALRMHPRREPL